MQTVAVLASRVLTTQRQYTAVADNVANANTTGYRKLSLDFKEMMGKNHSRPTASYVADRSITLNQEEGALKQTGNPLDLAVSGEGFFAIDVNGTREYTRNGQFVLNADGMLVTPQGYNVLDNAGTPIQFSQTVQSIRIGPDGTISTEEGQLGTVGVYTFDKADMGKLQRAGNTAFIPTNGATARAAESPVVRQGFLESSNVNPVQEMVNMQNASKAYQNSLTMLQGIEDLEKTTIQSLGGL